MQNTKNYTIITSQILVVGVPIQGWFISAGFSAFGLYAIKPFLKYQMFSWVIAFFIFVAIFAFLVIKTKEDPDYIFIKITTIFKIKRTKNKNFKGNCYVA